MFNLKKVQSAVAAFILLIPVLTIILFSTNPIVEAATSSSSLTVDVNHVVQIKNGGLIIVNDTVQLSTQSDQAEKLQSFALGFPYRYKVDLVYVYAYPASNPNSRLAIDLDVGLGTIGFYGVNVKLNLTQPGDDVNISKNTPYIFTISFVFSNRILFQGISELGEELFNATFPAYPSSALNVSTANVSVMFPRGATYNDSAFTISDFQNSTSESFQIFSYTRNNLTEFADESGWLSFSAPLNAFDIVEVPEVKRNIQLNGYEPIFISDVYQIISRSGNLSEVSLQLPIGAYQVTAWDRLGQIPSSGITIDDSNVFLSFSYALSQDNVEMFTVNYLLPMKDYIKTQTWNSFYANLTFLENDMCVIQKLTTTLRLPEGATLSSQPTAINLLSLEQSSYQTTLTFVYYNVTPFQNLNLNFTYEYSIFWESFRPTLWTGASVTIVAIVAVLWRFSKPTVAAPTIPIYPKELKSFIDFYEERQKINSELEALEKQMQKGKIPRRQYKLFRKTLESRFSVLSRELTTLREKIRVASSRYADMMRQVEVAENELQGIDADIRRSEVRHRRGEISASAYNKLLENVYRRRERAETTIDGVLLRLREEIS